MTDAKLAALFLLAIGTKRDEPDVALRDVMATADFYERVELEHGEIEAAVRFLLARHLITAHSDRFALTPAGRALAEGPLPRTYDAASRRLEAILEHLPEQQPTAHWSLDPARADAAVDAYEEMWRTQTES